jgi:hypothetical protein
MDRKESKNEEIVLKPQDLTLKNVGLVGVQKIKANDLDAFINNKDVTDLINLENRNAIQDKLKRKSEAMKKEEIGCFDGLFKDKKTIECDGEAEKVVIFRFGEILTNSEHPDGAFGPGRVRYLQNIDTGLFPNTPPHKVKMCQQTRELKDQLLITADLKFIIVKSIMIFQIFDPVKFLCNVTDADGALQLLCQSILRDVVGYHTLEFLNTNKNSITGQMQEKLGAASISWGARVIRFEILNMKRCVDKQSTFNFVVKPVITQETIIKRTTIMTNNKDDEHEY